MRAQVHEAELRDLGEKNVKFRILLALVLCSVSAFGVTVSVVPGNQMIGVGQVTSVNLQVDGNIGDFDLTVAWNGAIVDFLGYSPGTGLGAPGNSLFGDFAGPGDQIEIYEVSLFTDANDLLALQATLPFNILTMNFRGLAAGTSPLELTLLAIGDEFGIPFTAPATVLNGSITVQGPAQVVPEPSTWMLLGAGLAGIGMWRGRRA
jgi:hypothetical protein